MTVAMRTALVLSLSLTGCSQLLGLEDTRFDQRDAMVDAPSSCDGAPRCTSTTGRSVCGQLVGTGDQAGMPVRVADPTGESCASSGATEGPCALTLYGQAKAGYFTRSATGQVAGEIDDCGRFVVLDLDAAVADVAIVVGGTAALETATLLLGRETSVGVDAQIAAPVVTTATATAWGTQLSGANPVDVATGVLVRYVDAAEQPIAGQALRVNGQTVNAPPSLPWGVYFSGAGAFEAVDPSLAATQASGSALVVPSTGSFDLSGYRPGKTCPPVSLQGVAGALLHLNVRC